MDPLNSELYVKKFNLTFNLNKLTFGNHNTTILSLFFD